MRRLATILGLLLCGLPAHAAIAHVACSGTCTNSAVASSLTIPSAGTLTFTTGRFLVVAIRASSTDTFTFSSTTDTRSNTYHCYGPTNSKTPSGSSITLCYAWNITGGTDTITVSATTSQNFFVSVDEYSGVATACDPTYSYVTGATSSGTSATTSGTITPVSGDAMFAGGAQGSTGAWTAGSGFTLRAHVTNARVASEDSLSPTGGTPVSPAITIASSTDLVIGAIGLSAVCPAAPSGCVNRISLLGAGC